MTTNLTIFLYIINNNKLDPSKSNKNSFIAIHIKLYCKSIYFSILSINPTKQQMCLRMHLHLVDLCATLLTSGRKHCAQRRERRGIFLQAPQLVTQLQHSFIHNCLLRVILRFEGGEGEFCVLLVGLYSRTCREWKL